MSALDVLRIYVCDEGDGPASFSIGPSFGTSTRTKSSVRGCIGEYQSLATTCCQYASFRFFNGTSSLDSSITFVSATTKPVSVIDDQFNRSSAESPGIGTQLPITAAGSEGRRNTCAQFTRLSERRTVPHIRLECPTISTRTFLASAG